jgi:deoxyadenosine/deoxycytidine kinase
MFSSRNSRYEEFTFLRGRIFVIEGLIGVGKTTLGKSLEKYLNSIGIECKFFPEYVNNDLLDLYIKDMPREAFAFQLFMLSKRIDIYREATTFAKTGGIAIIDRSIHGDMAFAYMQKEKGFISEAEWNIYLKIVQAEIQLEPSATIFLNCDIEKCFTRLKIRGNKSESTGYTQGYFSDLSNAYSYIMNEYSTCKIINIDWNNHLEFDSNYLKNEVSEHFLRRIIDDRNLITKSF